jgi:hypothetical protein
VALVGNISGSIQNSSNIGVSGSVVIANRPDALFPTLNSVGGDVVFFVSGSRGGKGVTSERTVSVFGGDAVVSGSLTIGTGSITITSNDITFQGGIAQIFSGSGGLTFADSSGTKTLSELASGGGDVTGPASSTDNAIARFDLTTGKLLQNSAITVSDASGGGVTMDTGVSETTVNLFTTNATSVVIGKAGGSTVTTSGNIKVGSNTIQAADGTTALTLTSVSGDVTVAGDLTVTGNDIKSSTGATAITLSAGNVIIPGDLTVQGTTVTVDVSTLTIEDPVIGLGFTSGSTAVTAGDRGFIGGLSGDALGNSALFWDNSDVTFVSARTSNNADAGTPVAITSYAPFRASSFEIGGTPGSAVAAGSAYLSSSDALNVLVNHTTTTTFTKAGTPTIQISDYDGSGEGQIMGVTTANALSSLWLSGSAINVGSPSVAFLVNDVQQATIKPLTLGGGVRFEGQDGTGASRAMVISGSQTTIGSNNRLVVLEGSGVHFLTASVNAGLNTVTVIGSPAMTTASVFNANSTTVNFAGAATDLNIGAVTGNAYIKNSTLWVSGNIVGAGDVAVNGGDITTSASTFNLINTTATAVNFAGAGTDINIGAASGGSNTYLKNAATNVSGSLTVAGAANLNGAVNLGDATGDNIAFNGRVSTNLLPAGDKLQDLGGANNRWANIYTGDLHLKNERGDYTLIEEEDFLSIRFNKTGKRYKFILEPVPELDEK